MDSESLGSGSESEGAEDDNEDDNEEDKRSRREVATEGEQTNRSEKGGLRKRKRKRTHSASSPCRERDTWESDSFSELIASGYESSWLIDTRVGSSRSVINPQDDNLKRILFPERESTMYLLHVLILSAWVESKYHHASEVIRKWTFTSAAAQMEQKDEHDERMKALEEAKETSLETETMIKVIDGLVWRSDAKESDVMSPERWSELQKHLQMKNPAMLACVLSIGQRMLLARNHVVHVAKHVFECTHTEQRTLSSHHPPTKDTSSHLMIGADNTHNLQLKNGDKSTITYANVIRAAAIANEMTATNTIRAGDRRRIVPSSF